MTCPHLPSGVWTNSGCQRCLQEQTQNSQRLSEATNHSTSVVLTEAMVSLTARNRDLSDEVKGLRAQVDGLKAELTALKRKTKKPRPLRP